MTKDNLKLQVEVLRLLAGRIEDFYLTGGTALAQYYFQHRVSEDLDLFSPQYDRRRIVEVIEYLKQKLRKKITLLAANPGRKGQVRMAVYFIHQRGPAGLKIDFVEDYLELLEPCRRIDGIPVMSLPDIYRRKIYTVIGVRPAQELTGRQRPTGRQQAKDYFDLYCLSRNFRRLADFAWEHFTTAEIEALISWYRSHDRLNIKTGLLDLKILDRTAADPGLMDRHFQREIDRLLEKAIGNI